MSGSRPLLRGFFHLYDPVPLLRGFLHAFFLGLLTYLVLSSSPASASTTQGFLFLPFDNFHRDTSSYSTDLTGTVYEGQSTSAVFGNNYYESNAFDAANRFATRSPGITLSGVSWNPFSGSEFFLVGAANSSNTTVSLSPGYYKRWWNYGSGDNFALTVAGWQIDTVIDGKSVILGTYTHLILPFDFNEVEFSVISRTDTGVYISYDLAVDGGTSDGVCSFVESPPGSGDYAPNSEDLDCTGLEEWPEPPAPVEDGICPFIANPQNPFVLITDPDDPDCQVVAANPDAAVDYEYPPGEETKPVDKDGDGTPDINIDTNNDGTPDINIDTTGDGKPNVNIDIDGDGAPDINIDTNNDGIPDVDVDADGDGVPDENLDENNDGIPDIQTCEAVDEQGNPVCDGWDDLRIRYDAITFEANQVMNDIFPDRSGGLPVYTIALDGSGLLPATNFTIDFNDYDSVLSVIPPIILSMATMMAGFILFGRD